MAAHYIQKFASTADFLARSADRSLAQGLGAVSSIIYVNQSGSAVALLDASSSQTITGKTLGSGTLINLGADTSVPARTVGSLSDSSSNASGTVQNTEYTLNSVTIKANSFNRNGQVIVVEAWGTLAANANAKNLKIYFGGTAIATVTGSTANAKDFYITLTVIRTGASTQTAVGSIQIDTGTAAAMAVNAAVAETDTADIIIAVKSANTAAAAASGTGKGMAVQFGN